MDKDSKRIVMIIITMLLISISCGGSPSQESPAPGCNTGGGCFPVMGGCFGKTVIQDLAVTGGGDCLRVGVNNCNGGVIDIENSCQEALIFNKVVIPAGDTMTLDVLQTMDDQFEFYQIASNFSEFVPETDQWIEITGTMGDQSVRIAFLKTAPLCEYHKPIIPVEDFGVRCLLEFSDRIVAYAPNVEVFYTRDGGLTWQPERIEYLIRDDYNCNPDWGCPKELWVPTNGLVHYRFNPGESIEVSINRGQTWEMAYDLSQVQWESAIPADPDLQVNIQPGPFDAMIDPNSGNLMLAMGHAGILLRLSSGEWRWVRVGQYATDLLASTAAPNSQQDILEDVQSPSWVQVTPDIEIDTENRSVGTLAFSPDGLILAASDYEGGVKLYDFGKNNLLTWHIWGQDARNRRIYSMVFSPDGNTLVTCGGEDAPTLNIWDVDSLSLIKAYEGYQNSSLTTHVYADQQYLAIRTGHHAKIFQLPDGDEIASVNSNLDYISIVYFIRDTPYLAMGNTGGKVEIWDIDTLERVHYFPPTFKLDDLTSLSGKLYALGYDPSEELLMVLQGDGRLNAWNIYTGQLDRELVLHVPHGWYLITGTFSKNGRLVAIGMDSSQIVLFDSRTGQTLSQQWTSPGSLEELAFSPDDEWLAASYSNGHIKIWKVDRLIHQD